MCEELYCCNNVGEISGGNRGFGEEGREIPERIELYRGIIKEKK